MFNALNRSSKGKSELRGDWIKVWIQSTQRSHAPHHFSTHGIHLHYRHFSTHQEKAPAKEGEKKEGHWETRVDKKGRFSRCSFISIIWSLYACICDFGFHRGLWIINIFFFLQSSFCFQGGTYDTLDSWNFMPARIKYCREDILRQPGHSQDSVEKAGRLVNTHCASCLYDVHWRTGMHRTYDLLTLTGFEGKKKKSGVLQFRMLIHFEFQKRTVSFFAFISIAFVFTCAM